MRSQHYKRPGELCHAGLNDIVVTMRNHNRSAFNGYRVTPSRYSELLCLACGRSWRSRAKFVARLRDATDTEKGLPPFVP